MGILLSPKINLHGFKMIWFEKKNRFFYSPTRCEKMYYNYATMIWSRISQYIIIVTKWKFAMFFNKFAYQNFPTLYIFMKFLSKYTDSTYLQFSYTYHTFFTRWISGTYPTYKKRHERIWYILIILSYWLFHNAKFNPSYVRCF